MFTLGYSLEILYYSCEYLSRRYSLYPISTKQKILLEYFILVIPLTFTKHSLLLEELVLFFIPLSKLFLIFLPSRRYS